MLTSTDKEMWLKIFGEKHVCVECGKTFYCNGYCCQGARKDNCLCEDCAKEVNELVKKINGKSVYWTERLKCYQVEVGRDDGQ